MKRDIRARLVGVVPVEVRRRVEHDKIPFFELAAGRPKGRAGLGPLPVIVYQ